MNVASDIRLALIEAGQPEVHNHETLMAKPPATVPNTSRRWLLKSEARKIASDLNGLMEIS
jgi:hypothetical protein